MGKGPMPKGVVLAGGLGSRLFPLTKVTNKHLLPVYDKPMIYYPLGTLAEAGIEEVMVVTGGNNAADFERLIGDGKEFGFKSVRYGYQEGEGGIAAALALAADFARGHRLVVMLGDNVVEGSIRSIVAEYAKQAKGAKILLKEVQDPQRFGVPVLDGKKIVTIEEKPKKPGSPYAVTGIYMFDERVFDIVRTLKPSARGELEITDVNNAYIAEGTMTYGVLDGWWTDAGTFESLYRSTALIAKKKGVKA